MHHKSRTKAICVILLIFCCGVTQGVANRFIAGEHFKVLNRINPQQQPRETNAPQIIVFFNYGCYGCWLLSKELQPWLAKQNIKITVDFYPVVYSNVWEKLARFYYVNRALLSQQYNQAEEEIFFGIHHQKKKLWLEAEMLNFYAARNISKELFLQKYKSFDIDRKVTQATKLGLEYNINATPSIIINVNNKSYSVNFSMVPNPETLLNVIEFIIDPDNKG